MPFCSAAVLRVWLEEFEGAGPGCGGAYVVEQEAIDGRNSGLVVYPLNNSRLSVYIEPAATGSFDWCVTIEAHPEDTTVSTSRLRELCQELSGAAILCDFLEGKALAYHFAQHAHLPDSGDPSTG